MRVVISGAGPAGLTLALTLAKGNVACTVIEKSASIREAGYLIWLGATGFEIAERLGILPALRAAEIHFDRVDYLNLQGKVVCGYGYKQFSDANGGRMVRVMRYALQKALHDALPSCVDLRFDNEIVAITNGPKGVAARLRDGSDIEADLLVAADGAHSAVRDMAFGGSNDFRRPMGIGAAAYLVDGSFGLPGGRVYGYVDVGKHAGVYPVSAAQATAVFLYRHSVERGRGKDPIDTLRQTFVGWPKILQDAIDAMTDRKSLYFDDVEQVVMPAWSRERIAVIGDAAHCLSFLSGQGTSLAMAGAYALGCALTELPIDDALVAAERNLRPHVLTIQAKARAKAGNFLPRTKLEFHIRNAMIRASFSRWLAPHAARRFSEPSIVADLGAARGQA